MSLSVVAERVVPYACARCGTLIGIDLTDSRPPAPCTSCGFLARMDSGVLVMSADGPTHDDYPDQAFALLASVEMRHFWFVERNRLIVSTMREVLGNLSGRTVVDVGCGTGFVMAKLEQVGMLACGLDMHLQGLRYARLRTRGPLICESASRVPFRASFDVAMLCDVIEHVPDDVAVLRDVRDALVPGGSVVVTVPAHQSLWSAMDDASGHRRRYSRAMLCESMRRAGYRVHVARYFNALLLPVQFAQRRLLQSRAKGNSSDMSAILRKGLLPPPRPINAIMRLAMAADVLLTRLPVTIGSSLIAIGSRGSD
jgi:SAM-dependent methyltransferase